MKEAKQLVIGYSNFLLLITNIAIFIDGVTESYKIMHPHIICGVSLIIAGVMMISAIIMDYSIKKKTKKQNDKRNNIPL